jgi:hypothetical protein
MKLVLAPDAIAAMERGLALEERDDGYGRELHLSFTPKIIMRDQLTGTSPTRMRQYLADYLRSLADHFESTAGAQP